MLSTHARTLKAVIWHLEQKLVQSSTCKQRFEQLGFFLARQRPENGLARFKRHFLAKCPGVNGLIELPPYVLCRSKETSEEVWENWTRISVFFDVLKSWASVSNPVSKSPKNLRVFRFSVKKIANGKCSVSQQF